MKHVIHSRRERAANSQAADAERCCRRQARAIKSVTLQVMQSTQSSLNILEQLTRKNTSERVRIPAISNKQGHWEANASLGDGRIHPQVEGQSVATPVPAWAAGLGWPQPLAFVSAASQLGQQQICVSFLLWHRTSKQSRNLFIKSKGTVKMISTCIYC